MQQKLSKAVNRHGNYLCVREVAETLGYHPSWVYKLARSGKLASVKCGHYLRFREADLEDYANIYLTFHGEGKGRNQ